MPAATYYQPIEAILNGDCNYEYYAHTENKFDQDVRTRICHVELTDSNEYNKDIALLIFTIRNQNNAWKIHKMNIIRLYKEQGIDYSEQDLETYIKELKNTIIEDIKSTFKFAKNSKISTEYDSNLNEIIVLIFENQNIWKKAIGLKYGYFFIREEKDYCYSMVYNKKIFEGTLEELKGFFKSKKNVVGEFKFYLKWDWE